MAQTTLMLTSGASHEAPLSMRVVMMMACFMRR